MTARMDSELRGLDGFERDYVLLQAGKMVRRSHWTHANRC